MFYRRKIILALIQLLGGELEKIRIQKLLFLYSQKKKNPEFTLTLKKLMLMMEI